MASLSTYDMNLLTYFDRMLLWNRWPMILFSLLVYCLTRVICCELSHIQLPQIASWLKLAFVLCHEVPTLMQKVNICFIGLTLICFAITATGLGQCSCSTDASCPLPLPLPLPHPFCFYFLLTLLAFNS